MNTLNSLLSKKVKEKAIDFNDYGALFKTENDWYMFLILSENPDLKEDEVLLSMGSATEKDLIEYMNKMDKGDVKSYLEEHEVETVEEYIKEFPLHAIDDIVGYYGMVEFEVGYGEIWHKVKLENMEDFIKKYFDLYKI